jgi:DNA (cytosine-5)-methyltransferase 1
MKWKVAELFAGVGGFRVGLEKNKDAFEFSFVNQWEPNKKQQYAFDCYVEHFGNDNAYNEDIEIAKEKIPNNVDLMVGGFPCQDYSVATTKARGIEGKKGVLWWSIRDILNSPFAPKTILLENVDRLLKSPVKNRGRDFAIMLRTFHRHGYNVEWQVINAADYGMPQRRKRIFIFAYNRKWYQNPSHVEIMSNVDYSKLALEKFEILNRESVMNRSFPCEIDDSKSKNNTFIDLSECDEQSISDEWLAGKFKNKGYMINGLVFHYDVRPIYNGKEGLLNDVLDDLENIDDKYFLNKSQRELNKKLKGAKKIERITKSGFKYLWCEGQMAQYDDPFKPGRTMLTSEGTMNRSSHIIQVGSNKCRFLTPEEAERLNGFKTGWTKNMPERARYFCMGNALVVDIVAKLGASILKLFNSRYQLILTPSKIDIHKEVD